MSRAAQSSLREIEPLVRLSDLDEYKIGLAKRLAGEWDDEKFTGYRTRFGVYGQKQPGVQMIRIKVPGGIVPAAWLLPLARYNAEFCQGDLHITTRQDFQSYFVPLNRSSEALEHLYSNGMTTREACGNTFRNITACALAGSCPREHVDAGAVAERLSRSWIRHPLVQHMPRKVKMSVSGCGVDCGASAMHDVAFIATQQNGKNGFRILAGGGLGGQPRPAVEVLEFVEEGDLPRVVEATARLHQRYSDRVNRNAARLKFLVKRFGAEKFTELFREEYDRLKGLSQRPWENLSWRQPELAEIDRTPVGVQPQHDGRVSVVANPPLGNLSTAQIEEIAAITVKFGVAHIRLTRDQNFVIPNLSKDAVAEVVQRLAAINIAVPTSAAENVDVISCPGTTTCRIGITNSHNFGRAVAEEAAADASLRGVSVRVSGCQNSCGLHHVGEFGFHGVAKKIDGQPAPHYQIHLGGDARQGGDVGIGGPIIPARHGVEALRLLTQGYASGKQGGETVRSWAERLGKAGLAEVLAPIEGKGHDSMFVDWGDQTVFPGAPIAKGECAAPMASDDLLADMADDGLIEFDRQLYAKRWNEALQAAEIGTTYAARRLLQTLGEITTGEEEAGIIAAQFRAKAPAVATQALDQLEAHRTAALSSGKSDDYREALAVFIDTIRALVEGEAQDAAE